MQPMDHTSQGCDHPNSEKEETNVLLYYTMEQA